ncbi:hypothetical protein VTN77DRAFT_5293 [Rasamsonia byssochlamydoides]|uniref:uncharacterized protein n=1 Tax=Rasamsonia byssochlamydoides TaxID=89139 RepID=UPI003742A068
MQALLGSIFGPRKERHDLSGRVAVVTGGAFGIGYEISRAFVEAKAKVIMVNRNWDHGSAAIRALKKDFGSDAPIEWIHCDLGNLEETRKVFCTIREKEERLDILVLSAGINANPYGLDHDGIEHIFGVNWLGNFYATNLLYPLMRRTSKMPSTPAPRIVMESSEVHRAAPSSVKFQSLEEINDSNLGPIPRYARSKLAMILGVKYGLVERVIKPNGDNIYAIAVHPGTVNTAIQQQLKDAYPGILGKLMTNMSLSISRSPEQGACSAIYAAASPEIEQKGWNGVYLTDPGKLGKESSQASNPELGAALWNLSEELVKQKLGEDALADWHSC